MSTEAVYYYVTWPDKGIWTDRIPHSFFEDAPGFVEHLYIESEDGESAHAQAMLSHNGDEIILSYAQHPDWWEGTFRIWLHKGEPKVEWRDRQQQAGKAAAEDLAGSTVGVDGPQENTKDPATAHCRCPPRANCISKSRSKSILSRMCDYWFELRRRT